MALCLPFWEDIPNLVSGITGFAGGGIFNAPFLLLLSQFTTNELANSVGFICFAALAFLIWCAAQTGRPIEQTGFWIFTALLLFSPVVHYWYLLWLFPFFTLRPTLSFLTLSGTAGFYLLAWEKELWGLTGFETLLIWAPGLFLGALELPGFIKKLKNFQIFKPSQSLAIIVPTLNAADSLPALLRSISPPVTVVDGGSTDDTQKIAAAAGAQVINAQGGRGGQISAGVSLAREDLVVIAHADSVLPAGSIQSARDYFAVHPSAAHAVLGQRFDHATPLMLLVEILNEMRVVLNGTSFGDQVQIFRRQALQQVGGFPDQPLMEDVEASLRTLSLAPTGYLGLECIVSGEKWRRGRQSKRFKLVVHLVARYRLVRLRGLNKAAELTRELYRIYYGKKS